MHSTDAPTHPRKLIPVDLSQPVVLEVHIPNGDVTLRAADRADVLITHGDAGFHKDFDDAESELIVDARDNRIEVQPNPHLCGGWADVRSDINVDAVIGQITRAFGRGGPWSPGKPGKVHFGGGYHGGSDIAIEVPLAMRGQVTIHTASGDIRVEGVTAEIALQAMSGDVRAIRTSGDLALQSASGDLVAEGTSGRLSAHTASGDVRVTSTRIDGFQIQTANGDILIDALLGGDGSFRAQTASGDVQLTLRSAADGQEPAATLAFQTVSGDARVAAPFRQTDRRLWQAGADDRGPRLEVTTVNGDLAAGCAEVERITAPAPSPALLTEDAPPSPPSSSVQPASPPESIGHPEHGPRREGEPATTEARPGPGPSMAHGAASRLAVLAAVERGEIDIEEALRRLDAADATAGASS